MSKTLVTGDTAESDTLDFVAYRAAVSAAVVPLDVRSDQPDLFRGSLDADAAADIHAFGIRADPHSVHRTRALVARTADHYVKFTVIERGSGIIVQDGRETMLHTGDMAVYDTDRPYSLLFDDAIQMTVVMFPKALLQIPADPLSRLTAVRFEGDFGVGDLVRNFVCSLGRQRAAIDSHIARRLHRTAVDMIGTLLESNVTAAPRAQDTLWGRIGDYIDDHLGDHDLDPARIAQAHYISVRHLHGMFNEQGTTVSTVIRTRRLERCFDELVNPRNASRSVSTIAHGNGFVDAAHFSRTFRAHFGVAPSSLRG